MLRDKSSPVSCCAAPAARTTIDGPYLSSKLVAREADDDKATVLVLGIELLKTSVLGSEAALGGDVDDEDDLVLKGLHANLLLLLVVGLEVEKVGDGHVGCLGG